ncbi:precorrin-6A synthase (deacetylating) [Pseudooceanicola lipolyticus]|uniref:Precorrin-6A synthase [deacetylating] n=1 Tax=Pseudooceanicola lipolyticus TaxID=2029104 RepID=A0A2M8IYM8_9RHOB|nr:precorrin-6A synthase (deacetylating) [Pseudooceanicola lipolyticus]PJE35633.1 precorrin-6A synthase (deacetylating) [Pseudooceanicola lipolyticus]
MKQLFLIGIGTGNPDHVTQEARRVLLQADLVLIPRKGADKADLADLRRAICAAILPQQGGPRLVEFDLPRRGDSAAYLAEVDAWHDAIAAAWQAALHPHRGAPRVALLLWGDPSLYDSSLRIAARLDPAPQIQVVPGITALQVLTAAHAIPVNQIGAPFMVTTGRQLREAGWPPGTDTAVVMLDGHCAFQGLPGEAYDIWWGAFLGMPQQLLIHGRLAEVAQRIVETRAKARAEHGWIMDIYLLRRR